MFEYIRNAFSKKTKVIKKIRLGICAMDKKSRSKPMQEILGRFPTDLFEVVIFGDDCILNKPIDDWPIVECLIGFYSNHYPLLKAIEYVKLRQPFLINDLEMQSILKDRRRVYEVNEPARQ
jgi:inositol hexakisphosphate/diphosphoinositol-pentakisphosphate kinase